MSLHVSPIKGCCSPNDYKHDLLNCQNCNVERKEINYKDEIGMNKIAFIFETVAKDRISIQLKGENKSRKIFTKRIKQSVERLIDSGLHNVAANNLMNSIRNALAVVPKSKHPKMQKLSQNQISDKIDVDLFEDLDHDLDIFNNLPPINVEDDIFQFLVDLDL